MTNNMRLSLVIAGLFSAFFAPWWVTVFFMIALSVRYRAWEVLVLGLLMECLWLPAGFGHLPVFMLASILIVWIFEPLRDQLLV
jgi:hypothetical protein